MHRNKNFTEINPETPAVNPFLPSDAYIPDGEPHVFGDRVYLFGSHDREGGDSYCLLDYEFYSASVTNLSAWSSRGVNYSAKLDPLYDEFTGNALYAPDVVRGNDGRYYLYYCLSGVKGSGGYSHPISVAVCDEPDGKYEYYGVVKSSDGAPYMRYICFDPAVINDNGQIRLYYGTCYPFDDIKGAVGHRFGAMVQSKLFGRPVQEILKAPDGVMGAIEVELANDMLTVVSEGHRVIPTKTKGSEFDGHAFFEGASIRKIGEKYYFIYSSWLNHELCYAVSDFPDRGFCYGGTIISTGDIGYNGRKPEDRLNHTGTTHGSIEEINGQWYVFYHRLTHSTGYSRQACAEKIRIESDGSIRQVPVTSCGLSPTALPTAGSYPAYIACVLTDGKMEHTSNGKAKKRHPRITSNGQDRYIADICKNTLIGFRSFEFNGIHRFTLTTRGGGNGYFILSTGIDGPQLGEIKILPSQDWAEYTTEIIFPQEEAELYLRYQGTGSFSLLSLGFGFPEGANEKTI